MYDGSKEKSWRGKMLRLQVGRQIKKYFFECNNSGCQRVSFSCTGKQWSQFLDPAISESGITWLSRVLKGQTKLDLLVHLDEKYHAVSGLS